MAPYGLVSHMDQDEYQKIDPCSSSQVLAMTIRKKRSVMRRKNRNLRMETLLTSTIRLLCQEIGEQLQRSKKIDNKKRPYSSNSNADQEEVAKKFKSSVTVSDHEREVPQFHDNDDDAVFHDNDNHNGPFAKISTMVIECR